MDYAQKYNELKDARDLCEKSHNDILVKSISVSDVVLKEQLYEGYLIEKEKLDLADAKLAEFESIYLKYLTSEWLADLIKFYADQYIECELRDCLLQDYNLDIDNLAKKYRMRPIKSLEQKRELCLLLNHIGKQIHIIDYAGNHVETIGRKTETSQICFVRCIGLEQVVPVSTTCIRLRNK
jgi:hypothetical protein